MQRFFHQIAAHANPKPKPRPTLLGGIKIISLMYAKMFATRKGLLIFVWLFIIMCWCVGRTLFLLQGAPKG